MSDDLPELTPEQLAAFHRAAATLKDEDFNPEDMTGIRKGWLGLVKERAYAGPGVHYEQPEIHGQSPRGSFRLPRDVIAQLGDGDLKAGGAVVAGMFGVEPDSDFPVDVVHADVVRDVGHGSLAAGRRVLEKFVARVRRQSRAGVILEHDGREPSKDGHGWSVRR
jgi:hypothetical protein